MASLFLPGLPHPARWPGELQLGPIYDEMTVGPRKELLLVVAQTQQKIDMGQFYSVGPRPMKNLQQWRRELYRHTARTKTAHRPL